MFSKKKILDKLEINPVTLIFVILSLMLSIIFSETLYFNLIILGSFCAFTIMIDLFYLLFLDPLKKFKIFILFSLLFMILSNFTPLDILIYIIKVAILLLFSSFLNQFLDYNYLLNYFDSHLSKIKPRFLRIYSRKILYSFILGIRSVSELFQIGKNIIRLRKIRGFKKSNNLKSKINENIDILRTLFIQSFYMAKKTDLYFSGHGFSFSKQRSFFLRKRFELKDYFLIVISTAIVVL
ncbi:MAG: energy-coupling factor transporter transmembrane component T [Candidatus Delongbacteria bacterium]|jgi:energy-coupling factor transporter transmembrane protein EcfT|nr:energy-coupling factor transporter transmembrane component T [Candidatus Delongbacteria bacterium]